MWGCGGNVFWAFQLLVSHFVFIMTTCSQSLASICQRTMSLPSIKTTSLPSEVWIFCHTAPIEIDVVNHCFLLCDCHSQDETEFRDKLSPININFNYSLDESSFEDSLTVKPILNYYQKNSLAEQVWILHATFSVYKHESIYEYYVCHLPWKRVSQPEIKQQRFN